LQSGTFIASMPSKYDHKKIEKKWQKYWEDNKIWEVKDDTRASKFYVLDMFPYPSAEGLHVGHPEGYTASDIVARYLRMKGKNVLHPMGFDSFGLPAENYAIKTGTHPVASTEKNIKNMREQIKRLGFSYDWSREVITSDLKYYKWTQWIFVQLFKKGLAYEADVPINWCPSCKTGLANEEVVNGKCERCGSEVTKKQIKQWLVRITDERYIERLLNDLDRDEIEWPENIKMLQKNWIGRSEGATVRFSVIANPSKVEGEAVSSDGGTNDEIATSPSTPLRVAQGPRNDNIEVFTTRPDTLFGATYMVLSPEHPLVDKITTPENHKAVRQYQKKASAKSDLERTDLAKEKTGVFTGAYAVNPVNNKKIPIWVADYVLISYGTGAIMAVPAHDVRDFEFAKKFKLPIIEVIKPPRVMPKTYPTVGSAAAWGMQDADIESKCWTGDGIMVNSGKYDGMDSVEFKKTITKWLGKEGKGKAAVNYKLRDWLFSRQRYWGEPIPIVHCEECKKKDKKTVLIIHGTGGYGRKNWYPWLADKLRRLGHEVYAPDLPDADQPVLEEWVSALERYSDKLGKNSVVIGHSLGGFAAQHLVSRLRNKIGKLILVSPSSSFMDWKKFAKNHPDDPVEYQSKFHEKDVQYDKVRKNTFKIIYFCSDNDFYISKDVPAKDNEYLKADLRILPGRNHFSAQHGNAYTFPELFEEIVGMNPWPVGLIPVPEKNLPVELPKVRDYKPTGTGESPLAAIKDWVNTKCPKCGGPAKRETNTMPQWAGSNWYFLRYLDSKNDKQLADPKKIEKWMPVDLYVGGAEHAVLHLLYARFIYKFLFDLEIDGKRVIPKECGDEPFKRLKNQGIILGEDGQKMSKSRGNVINPDEVIEKYGADTMRMYEMFMGPFEDPKPWSTESIRGIYRFLKDRIWVTLSKIIDDVGQNKLERKDGVSRAIHKAIKGVTKDIERFKFNTAISWLMIFFNQRDWGPKLNNKGKWEAISDIGIAVDLIAVENFLKILAPFAPHISEELWERLGHKDSIFMAKWPVHDERKLKELEEKIVVQVDGKVRATIIVDVGATQDEIQSIALNNSNIKKYVTGKPKKVIFIKGRLINFVI